MAKEYIRFATTEDSADLLNIYAHYVENTVVTFEIVIPTIQEFSNRVETISEFYPYLVYVIDGKTVGYAYASRHKERQAYRFDVEVSVYLDEGYLGFGIGSKLYACIFEILTRQGIYNVYSGITQPNERSEMLHKKFGFTPIGVYHKAGYKHDKWRDVIWYEKTLIEHGDNPSEVINVHELNLSDLIKQIK